MLNRRSFITISVAGAGVAAAGVITPALTAAADESTSTGNTQIQIGPVAVLAGTTILQVAAKKADFDFFTSSGAFSKSSNGLLVPSGIRLLSQERGVALTPISEQPEVKPKAPPAVLVTVVSPSLGPPAGPVSRACAASRSTKRPMPPVPAVSRACAASRPVREPRGTSPSHMGAGAQVSRASAVSGGSFARLREPDPVPDLTRDVGLSSPLKSDFGLPRP